MNDAQRQGSAAIGVGAYCVRLKSKPHYHGVNAMGKQRMTGRPLLIAWSLIMVAGLAIWLAVGAWLIW